MKMLHYTTVRGYCWFFLHYKKGLLGVKFGKTRQEKLFKYIFKVNDRRQYLLKYTMNGQN